MERRFVFSSKRMSASPTQRGFRDRLTGPSALVLLSLLWACSNLRAELLPAVAAVPVGRLERQALPLVLLAGLATAFALLRKEPWPRGRLFCGAILLGAGLFLLPALLENFSAMTTSAYTRTMLLTLASVFAVVFAPYMGGQGGGEIRHSLVAALAGVAGALLVFPAEFPGTFAPISGFTAAVLAAACLAATNCYAVTWARDLGSPAEGDLAPRVPLAASVAVAAGSAAAGLLSVSAFFERSLWQWKVAAPEWLWSAMLELPALLLLFWLFRRVTAVQMTTRFTLAPLLAVLVGSAALRASMQARTWLGLLLMAAGSGWLLFAPQDVVSKPSRTLGL